MQTARSHVLLPRGLRFYLGFIAAFLAVFVLTAPWRIAGQDVGRLSVPLAAAAALCLLALLHRPWRRALVGRFREGIGPVSGGGLFAAALVAAAFLARVGLARYLALELSAWDTTVLYDRPIAETLEGRFFYCDWLGGSYFGSHVSALLFGFLPLYALHPTPLWLLGAQALAIAAGAAAGFLAFRRILDDDLAAGFLAAAFVLNGYTAKTVQYGFHMEVFYPLAAFLLWLGLLCRRSWLLAAGTLIALGVKEDCLLLLGGFALSAALFQKRYRVAAAVAGAGVVGFFVGTRIVMSHFSGASPWRPWYAAYWVSWGDTLPRIALAMLTHPLRVAETLARSGIPHLLEPLLLLPLAGPEGLVAALPALVPYAAADYRPLRAFSLYYSMPVLPFLLVGATYGIARLAASASRRRLAALAVLAACALDGAGYTFPRANHMGTEIAPALASLGARPARIQGSLYPRAGYSTHRRALDRARPLAPSSRSYPRIRVTSAAAIREGSSSSSRGTDSIRHLLVAESEHVADLVHHGVADLAHGFAAGRAETQDRAAEDGDLGRQVRDERPALEEGHAAEDAEHLLFVGRVGFVVVLVGRLLLDDHDDVLEVLAEPRRNRGQGLLDAGLELGRGDALRRNHATQSAPLPAGEGRRNRRSKVAVVAAATVSRSVPLTSASFFAVSTTKAGSQGLPRCGTGDR